MAAGGRALARVQLERAAFSEPRWGGAGSSPMAATIDADLQAEFSGLSGFSAKNL